MAKNQVTVDFNADVSGFNDSIKKANSEMKQFRAEAKLSEAQLKENGISVESLEKKHTALLNQQKANETIVEALNGKIQTAIKYYGENSEQVTRLRTQLANAETAQVKLNSAVDACSKELDEQRAIEEKLNSATNKLTSEISDQEGKLSRLKSEYANYVLEGRDATDEAQNLAREISELSTELKQNKDALSDASKKADDLDKSFDDAGDSAENAGDGFTIMKGAVADLASEAIQMAIGKLSEFIGYLAELPEATRELRQDFATLETSFDNVGLSTKEAESTWKDLYAVFGEDDRAVEAANHISKMSDNQKDLNDWVTITTGVWGTYQDSLPVEGLAEASNETAKTGKVTGVLADALNWSSEAAVMFADKIDEGETAEDGFNKALAECTTEQERQKLITETLTKLYGGAAETYRETAGAQMEAKEATAENMLAEADLAESIEPVTTAFTELKTTLLDAFAPAIETVSGYMVDALEWANEHPTAMKAITAAVAVLAAGLTALAVAAGIYTAAQWAMNSAILANPVTWIVVGVIAAIAALIGILVVVVEHWDAIKEACLNCWNGIKETLSGWGEWINANVIQPVKQFFSELWSGIKENASSLWEGVKNVFSSFVSWVNESVIQPMISFFKKMWDGIKTIWDGICNVVQVGIMLIGSIISAAFQIITVPFKFIWENCKQYVFAAWSWIQEKISTIASKIGSVVSSAFSKVRNFFKTIWNSCKSIVASVWSSIEKAVSKATNSVRTVVSKAWNSVKKATQSVFNSCKSTATSIWSNIKKAISKPVEQAKTKIVSTWNKLKSATKSAFNSCKSVATSIWSSLKKSVVNTVNSCKSSVVSTWNNLKNTTRSVFNSCKSTATSVWKGIKNAITKPIEQAKNKVKSIVDAIKGFFKNMKLSLPKIKMPHFKITGKLSLNPPSVPKLSIQWYKQGGIMTRPTIFGMNGTNFMAGGEAGPEAILPIDKLEGYISNAVEKTMNVVNLQSLANSIETLASRPIELYINDRQIAVATASASDSVNGLRTVLKDRGLVLG